MKLKLIVWMIVIMLALPLAIALFPYSPAGNTAPNDAFMKSSNESFNTGDSMVNWSTNGNLCTSTEGNLVCPAKTNGGHEANYIHELINPLTNAGLNGGNFTIFEGDIRVIDGSGTGFVANARSVNYTGAGNWFDNSVLSLRMQGATDHGATCPATTPAGSVKSSVALARWGDAVGTDSYDSINGLCADGTLNHIQIVISSVNDGTAYAFLNGTLVSTITPLENQGGTVKAFPLFWTFGVGVYSNWASFNVSNYVTFNGSICNMSGAAPPIPEPDEQQFTITAADTYDAESLKNITITIFNSSNSYDFTTGNGTVLVSNKTSIESFNVTYNITFSSNQSGGYLNHTIPNINLSDGGSFIGDLYQAILRVNATEIISGTQIVDFLASVPLQSNQSNSSGFATLLLKAGNYNVTGNKTGYLNSTSSISINALDDAVLTLEFATHRLRIDARDKFSNETISSFNVTITGLDITHSETKSTTTGNISFDIEAGDFSVDIFGNDNYALESGNVSVDTTFTNHTFLLFPRNSILITVYEEGTSTQIGNIGVTDNRTTTADFDSTLQVLNLSSANGTILAESIQPTNYLITVGSAGFDSRQYFITLNPDSHVGLNAYLINITDTSSITFTVKDISDQKELPNIRISVSDKINLTYVTIDQKDTDIAGQAVFDLDQTKTYRFTMSGTGYETRTFDLKPITTAYTIELTPFAKIDFTTIFNSVDFVTLPVSSIIINTTDLINFSIITTSLTGITIKHFGLNTTYLGVLSLTNVSGSAGGGTASIFLNLSNMTGSVGVTYFIDIDGEIPFILNREFLVTNLTKVNQSMEVTLKDFSKQIGQPIGAIVGTIFIILIMATFASMGLRDRRMNVIGALALGFVAFQYGFFGEITATSMTAYLIGAVMLGLMITYFIGGMRSEDD